MRPVFKKFLDINDFRAIESVHKIQRNLYGVCKPPSLKQLISLRHLLVRTGAFGDIQPDELLGLSKAECDLILKKLNKIYISQRRNQIWNEVEPVEEVSSQN